MFIGSIGSGKIRCLASLYMPTVVNENEVESQGAKEVYTVKEFLELKKKLKVVCVDELELVLGRLLDCYVDSATITER